MTPTRHGARRLPLALVAAVLAGAPPAAAHTELLRTSVPAGAVVPARTPEVVLSFSGGVRPELSAVVVTGPSGDGTRGRLSLRGDDVVQPLAAPLAPGTWTLSYRVVADDGHPITGTLPFRVAGASSSTTAAPTPQVVRPGSADEPQAASDGLRSTLLPGAGLLAAAGLLGLLLLRRRARP